MHDKRRETVKRVEITCSAKQVAYPISVEGLIRVCCKVKGEMLRVFNSITILTAEIYLIEKAILAAGSNDGCYRVLVLVPRVMEIGGHRSMATLSPSDACCLLHPPQKAKIHNHAVESLAKEW